MALMVSCCCSPDVMARCTGVTIFTVPLLSRTAWARSEQDLQVAFPRSRNVLESLVHRALIT